MKIDPKLAEIFKKYGGDADKDLWDCHGTWVAYHKALERIAVQAKITFDPPYVIEGDGEKWSIAICVTGNMGDRVEWSIGEASQHNYKTRGKQTAFPYAMAEKRGKDRVILKLIGLHGLVYSEEEADDFKQAPASRKDSRQAYEDFVAELREIEDPKKLEEWLRKNNTPIRALYSGWVNNLKDYYANHMATLLEKETGAKVETREMEKTQ